MFFTRVLLTLAVALTQAPGLPFFIPAQFDKYPRSVPGPLLERKSSSSEWTPNYK